MICNRSPRRSFMASSTQSIFSVQREISELLNSLNQTKFLQQTKNPKISKIANNINNLGVYSPHFEEYTFQHGCRNVRCACAMNASKPSICPKCHKSMRLTLVKVKRIDRGPLHSRDST